MSKLLIILAMLLAVPAAGDEHVNHTVLKKLAWQFAFPTDSLGTKSILEAGKVAKSLTVHHLEVVLDQPLSDGSPTKLTPTLEDASLADFQAQLKSVGLDVVSLRVNRNITAEETGPLLRLAKKLGVKVLVLPSANADLAHVASDLSLKIAAEGIGAADLATTQNLGVTLTAGHYNAILAPVMNAQFTANREADDRLIQDLLLARYKGPVSIHPVEKTQAAVVEAMDTFAAALHEVPTTQP